MPAVGEIIACDIDISIFYAAPGLTLLLHTVNARGQGEALPALPMGLPLKPVLASRGRRLAKIKR